MGKFLLTVVLASAAFAQVTPPVILQPGEGTGPSLALRQYLDLTNAQVASMVRLNAELNRFQGEKFRRAAQVSNELAQEMRRENLDPMAIGLRHVELEAIRREIAAEQQRVARETQALLTPAQRPKVQALQEVLRMYPLACEALAMNLMAPPQQQPVGVPPGTGGGSGQIGSFLIGAPACGGLGVRTGDFNFQPTPPPNVP